MPNVQIRDVSDEVHRALVQRAETAGQSLQQFLATQLDLIASTPTVDEMLSRIEQRSKGRVAKADALEGVKDARGRR